MVVAYNNLLIKAAKNGWLRSVKFFIESGASINAVDSEGKSLLWHALRNGKDDVAKYLIINGANFTDPSFNNNSALWYAVRDNKLDLASLLIEKGADTNAGDYPVLVTATQQGNLEMVEMLLEKGALPNKIVTKEYRASVSALFVAVANRKIDIVRALLKKNADVNFSIPNDSGLDHYNTFVNATSCKGATALWFAAASGYSEIAELLIKNGALIESAPTSGDYEGQTPLFAAAYRSHLSTVKLLLENGALTEAAPANGIYKDQTPIWSAASNGDLEIAKLLIEHRSKLDATVLWFGTSDKMQFLTNTLGAALYQLTFLIKHPLIHGKSELKVAKLLIENGAKFDYESTNVIKELNSKMLSELASSFDIVSKTSSDAQTVSSAILCRSLLLKKKSQDIKTPEIDEHDISFAKGQLKKVKDYYIDKKKDTPVYTLKSFIAIRDCIVERIIADTSPETVQSFKDFLQAKKGQITISHEEFKRFINKNDANHRALEWIMSFESSELILKDKQLMDLIKEMLAYIVAARDDLLKDGMATKESKAIEDALILQLYNAMDANYGKMSCAPGTPRFLRVALELYMNIVSPDKSEIQHEQLQQSTFTIINNLLRSQFRSLLSHINVKDIVKKIDELNKLKNNLARSCEALTTICSDNADLFLASDEDKIPKGTYTDEPVDAELLKLRSSIMYTAYPDFDLFRKAVISNMHSSPEIKLTKKDEAYLQLIYVAIADKTIKDKLYESLDTALSALNIERAKVTASATLDDAMASYKNAKTKDDIAKASRQLKNILSQQISLMVGGDINLEASDNVASNIIKGITKGFSANEILSTLKDLYTNEASRLDANLNDIHSKKKYP